MTKMVTVQKPNRGSEDGRISGCRIHEGWRGSWAQEGGFPEPKGWGKTGAEPLGERLPVEHGAAKMRPPRRCCRSRQPRERCPGFSPLPPSGPHP